MQASFSSTPPHLFLGNRSKSLGKWEVSKPGPGRSQSSRRRRTPSGSPAVGGRASLRQWADGSREPSPQEASLAPGLWTRSSRCRGTASHIAQASDGPPWQGCKEAKWYQLRKKTRQYPPRSHLPIRFAPVIPLLGTYLHLLRTRDCGSQRCSLQPSVW